MVCAATLLPGSEPRLPERPDPLQIGVRWVPLGELDRVQLLPAFTHELVATLGNTDVPDLYDIV